MLAICLLYWKPQIQRSWRWPVQAIWMHGTGPCNHYISVYYFIQHWTTELLILTHRPLYSRSKSRFSCWIGCSEGLSDRLEVFGTGRILRLPIFNIARLLGCPASTLVTIATELSGVTRMRLFLDWHSCLRYFHKLLFWNKTDWKNLFILIEKLGFYLQSVFYTKG